jgi:YaiO family outer membrane protein
MPRTFYIILFGIVSLGCLTVPASAQNELNAEREYLRIREIAFNGELATAETDARRLVKKAPEYGDARILLGRILAWQKKYGEAAAVIDTLLATDPDNSDAISARKDISQWSKSNTPVSTELKAGYSFDQFGLPYSRFWQIFNAGAGHKFRWGKGSAGVNIGNLITGEPSAGNSTEIQFEAEAWPRISDKNYGFVSYAYSPGTSFPAHRAAAEFWQVLPKGFAVSAGMNFYYFDSGIFIALISCEKYIGNYWFSAKGFLYFKDIGPTSSLYLNGRRYFGDRDYLQATVGFGTAPDEPFDIQSDLMRLSAYSLRLSYSLTVSPKISLRIGAGYSLEEYAESTWRNRFEGGIALTYAMKMK